MTVSAKQRGRIKEVVDALFEYNKPHIVEFLETQSPPRIPSNLTIDWLREQLPQALAGEHFRSRVSFVDLVNHLDELRFRGKQQIQLLTLSTKDVEQTAGVLERFVRPDLCSTIIPYKKGVAFEWRRTKGSSHTRAGLL